MALHHHHLGRSGSVVHQQRCREPDHEDDDAWYARKKQQGQDHGQRQNKIEAITPAATVSGGGYFWRTESARSSSPAASPPVIKVVSAGRSFSSCPIHQAIKIAANRPMACGMTSGRHRSTGSILITLAARKVAAVHGSIFMMPALIPVSIGRCKVLIPTRR